MAAPPPELRRDSAARTAVTVPAPPAPPAAPTVQDEAAGNEADQASASSGSRLGDEPADEVPPATVGSPEVRDAWLQRIHGLVDAGDIAGARASLREFERRYPDYPLPEDLRALAR
jgi:Meckel syndrome type 1 protein